jgi:hypothetical protein
LRVIFLNKEYSWLGFASYKRNVGGLHTPPIPEGLKALRMSVQADGGGGKQLQTASPPTGGEATQLQTASPPTGSEATQLLKVPFLNTVAVGLHLFSGFAGLTLLSGMDPRTDVVAHHVNFTPEHPTDLFQPFSQRLFTWRPVLGFVALEFVLAFFHAVFLYRGGLRPYTPSTAEGMGGAPLRWFEYAITQSLTVVFLASALGVQDAFVLFKLLIESIALQTFGWVLEKMDARVPREAFAGGILLVAAFVFSISTVAVIAWSAAASSLHSMTFALCVLPVGFRALSIAFLMTRNFYRQGALHDAIFAEKAYLVTSIMCQLSVFWLVLTAYLSAYQARGLMPVSMVAGMALDLEAIRISSIVIPPALLMFVLSLESYNTPAPIQKTPPLGLWQAVRMGAPGGRQRARSPAWGGAARGSQGAARRRGSSSPRRGRSSPYILEL